MRKTFWNSLWLIIICFVALGLPLVYEYAKGNLSPRQLATGFLMLIGCLFGFIVLRLTRGQLAGSPPAPSDGRSPAAAINSLRTLRAFAVILPVILILASWITRDEPLLPRAIGAAINIFFTCWLLLLLSRARRSAR